MSKLQDMLSEMNACGDAESWVSKRTLKQAWTKCERADWMLWLVGKMCEHPQRKKLGWPTRKQVVLAACDCAETSLRFVPDGEERPAGAIRVTRAWCHDRATLQQVCAYAAAAAHAAHAADAADAAHAAAYAAAHAAAHAAAYAAADAAAYAAAYAAADARCLAHKTMCKLIRKRLKCGRLP